MCICEDGGNPAKKYTILNHKKTVTNLRYANLYCSFYINNLYLLSSIIYQITIRNFIRNR